MRILILTVISLMVFGCGPSTPSSTPSSPCTINWSTVEGHIVTNCGEAALELQPRMIAFGEWIEPEGCIAEASSLACAFNDAGTLTVDLSRSGQLVTAFKATHEVSFNGFVLTGNLRLPAAQAWLSNGFQSWSQSGVIAIGPEPSSTETTQAVTAIGDLEVLRSGHVNSWWHTFVKGEISFVAGVNSAAQFKSWIQVSGIGPDLKVKLVSGGSGEEIQLQVGDEIAGETWHIGFNENLTTALSEFGASLPRRNTSSARPEAGWNSWYELWSSVDEEAVRSNAVLAQEILGPLTDEPLRIVIDDGWQSYWGQWQPNEKFPSTMEGLARDLKADGFNVGIWLAPLLVEEDSELARNNPDWFVEGAYFGHLGEGNMLVLDVTHPEAARHISESIERIVGWGYDLLKIDFLFAGTFEGGRHENKTGMAAYEQAMALIRDAAGPDVVLLAVGAPPIAGFNHVDAWRIGPDIAVENFDASWFFIPSEARTIGARWPYCSAVLCDGDPPILRTMSRNEVEVSLWTAALAGGAFFLSDDLRNLEEERHTWVSQAMVELAITGSPAIPDPAVPTENPDQLATQLFDHTAGENRHKVPHRWTLPDGRTLYLNFGEEPISDGEFTVPTRSARLE